MWLTAWLAVLVGAFMALPVILIAPAETVSADVIVHQYMDAGSDADAYVAQLYHQSVARKIVCVSSQVGCDVYPADYVARHLVTLGVREEDVITLRLSGVACWAESLPEIIEYLRDQRWSRVLLVMDPIGSRFDGWVARRYFERAGLQLAITYSPGDRQASVQGWWRTHAKAQRMIGNAVRVALDLVYPQCR